jgi:ubiquinone/menaquinone biosynthesis C-methylase UbiE
MENIRKFYDSTAHRYDLRQSNPSTQHLRQAEEKLLRKFARGRLLDVGCGTGYHLEFMEKNGIGEELVGIDVSPNMLKEARKRCKCELKEARAEDLPFPGASFDTIICFHGTFNFVDPKKAASEMARVLKKGGVAMLSVTSIWDKEYPPVRKKLKAPKENVVKAHRIENTKLRFNLFSPSNLVNLFENAGFRKVRFGGLFIYQRPYWGRFESFNRWQKIKLSLDDVFPFNRLSKAGTLYLAVFRKIDSNK